MNEVVQKVSGSDQPLRLWTDEGKQEAEVQRDSLLYSFSICLKVKPRNNGLKIGLYLCAHFCAAVIVTCAIKVYIMQKVCLNNHYLTEVLVALKLN